MSNELKPLVNIKNCGFSMDQFMVQVSHMRNLQRRYFLTRSKKVLIAAKASERKVDEMIEAASQKGASIGFSPTEPPEQLRVDVESEKLTPKAH